MNKERRKRIESVIEKLSELRGEIEDIQAEEEEYRDNMPENLQGSERYEKADSAVDALDSAKSSCDDAETSLNEAIED